LPRRVLLALEKRIFHPYFSSVTGFFYDQEV
jgi:hypothetical protein